MAKQKRYGKEFKLGAARLVVEQGYTHAEAAQPTGGCVNLTRNVMELGIGKHRFSQVHQGSRNAGSGAVEKAEADFEGAHMWCNLLGHTHRVLGGCQVEGDDDRRFTHHCSTAPISCATLV